MIRHICWASRQTSKNRYITSKGLKPIISTKLAQLSRNIAKLYYWCFPNNVKKIWCFLEILEERFLRQYLLWSEYVIHSHEVEVEKVRFWQSHYSVKEENEIDPLLSYNVIVSDEEKRVPTKERHRKRWPERRIRDGTLDQYLSKVSPKVLFQFFWLLKLTLISIDVVAKFSWKIVSVSVKKQGISFVFTLSV